MALKKIYSTHLNYPGHAVSMAELPDAMQFNPFRINHWLKYIRIGTAMSCLLSKILARLNHFRFMIWI
jgi:hypothetical protein